MATPSNIVYPSIHGRVMRLTRMDACGVPITGPKSVIVSECMTKVDLKAEREDGKDITKPNANGKLLVNYKSRPQLKWLTADIEMALVHPEAINVLTGDPLALDALGNSVGFSQGDTIESYFSLELWGDVPGVPCGTGANAQPYTYLCLPLLTNGVLGDYTVEDDALTMTVSANTQGGHAWGAGPYNVDLDASATPAPGKLVTPITPKQHQRLQLVRVAPPAVTTGAVAFPLVAA